MFALIDLGESKIEFVIRSSRKSDRKSICVSLLGVSILHTHCTAGRFQHCLDD